MYDTESVVSQFLGLLCRTDRFLLGMLKTRQFEGRKFEGPVSPKVANNIEYIQQMDS